MIKELYLSKLIQWSDLPARQKSSMEKIIRLKLLIKERKMSTLQRLGNISIYLLYSVLVCFFLFQKLHMMQLNIIFAMTLFVWLTAMISEYIPQLFDFRDSYILEGKTVERSILSRAKFIVVFYDILLLLVSFSILPLLVAILKQGILFACLFLLALVFMGSFAVGLSMLVYTYIFEWFSGRALRNAINLLQLFFIILIIIVYQVIIRMYGFVDFSSAFQVDWWHYLLPSFWFAAPFQAIFISAWDMSYVMMSLLGLILSILVFWLGIKRISIIEARLVMLEKDTVQLSKRSWITVLAGKWLCCSDVSRSNFNFINRLTGKSWQFKLKIMPSLAVSLLLPFLLLFSIFGYRSWDDLSQSSLYLFIYMIHLFMGVILYYFQFSKNAEAVWIYKVSAGRQKDEMYSAVFKVYFIKYYLPLFLLVSVIYYFIFKHFLVVDGLIVFISGLIQYFYLYRLMIKTDYPFSLAERESEATGTLSKSFLMMLFVLPFMALHFLSDFIFLGKYLYLLILIMVSYPSIKKLK